MKTRTQEKQNNIPLNVLSALTEDNKITQRSLSSKLGIALGLINAYMKRAMDKGLVKIKHVPKNRYLYYLTPKGFTEKAKLTAEYLKSSLIFYRKARIECNKIIFNLTKSGEKKILLSDKNDLAEIFILSALGTKIKIIGLLGKKEIFLDLPVFSNYPKSRKVDAVIITSIENVEQRYADIAKYVDKNKIIIPSFLRNKIGKI